MKRLLLLITLAGSLAATGCLGGDDAKGHAMAPNEKAAVNTDPASLTTIQWLDSVKQIGRVMEGQKVEVAFRFKNTGDKPLIIESATPSCGCTVAQKPEQAIMPGGESQITAIFDTKGRLGNNTKTMTVRANTQFTQSHVLQFAVEVVDASAGPVQTGGGDKKDFH